MPTTTRPTVAPVLLRIPDFGAAAGVSRATVYNWIAAGLVASVKIAGSRRIPASELERLAGGGPDAAA